MKGRAPLPALLALLVAGCSHAPPPAPPTAAAPAPAGPGAPRELRAAWVATVHNIDWPSRPGLDAAEQQCEARAILDAAARLHLNAIVLQVRPHADALYPSELEPWSSYLSGEQGRPPSPEYDPLDFWIEEAHERGLQLHAWFNPYRAHRAKGGPAPETSIVRRRPELVRRLPDGDYWMDPAMPEAREHSLAVILDVVRRYDVDAVHFDDYFYPYGDGSFDDTAAWEAYRSGGGALSRSDWRREAINAFVKGIHDGIRALRPKVQLGISPFGIWRPGHPPSIAGFDAYEGLYADSRLWLREGWVDYLAPQLYWPIGKIPQSFPVLLGWWAHENPKGRHLWPGLYVSRMVETKGPDEVVNQIMVVRGFLPEAPGHIHFSMKALLRADTPLAAALRSGPYASPALVPPTPWLDDEPPAPPSASASAADGVLSVRFSPADAADVFRWVVTAVYEKGAEVQILDRRARSLEVPSAGLRRVTVSAVDRLGNESAPVVAWAQNA